jgi:formylmethanofuran dehydrogenase subunit E
MTFRATGVIKQAVKPCEQANETERVARPTNENMRTRIQDEFTHLPISRQRKYQLRRQRDKRCTECGEPAVEASRCIKHLVKARERQRLKRGLKRRYYGTLSYKLEAWLEPMR